MKGFNKQRMGSYNRLVVLKTFYQKEYLTIGDIASKIDLTIPTISNIFKELRQMHFIMKSDKEHSARGRSQGYWTLNHEREVFLAIEISPYNIKGLVVDASGSAISKIMRIEKHFKKLEDIIPTAVKLIKQLQASTSLKIKRCAIGIHGVVDYKAGISVLFPHIKEKKSINIQEKIEKETGLKIIIDNDCNTKALAEKWLGEANFIDNFIWMNLDYGIGSALTINGDIFRGNQYTAGQIGHTTVIPDGPLCSCGNHGCLEAVFSTNALLEKVHYMESEGKKKSIEDFYADVAQNREPASHIFSTNVKYLAQAVSILINIISPEHIFFGGNLCNLGNILMEEMLFYLNQNPMYRKHKPQELSFSALTEEQCLAGAVFLWIEEDLSFNLF